jgi:NAD(P)-dependent dehydrogenase (short-subunit alcohol dehydrogenase family)
MIDVAGGHRHRPATALIRRLRAVGAQLAACTSCTAAAAAGVQQQLPAQRLGTKVCLVTGGASGIGKAICVQLAREGATVVAFDVRRAPREGGKDVISLMRAARQSESLPAQQDLFIEGDVSNVDSVQGAIVTTVESFGRLDVLVNNAAKMNGHALLDTSEEEWDDIMAVNAKGVFLFSKAAVKQFLQQPRLGSDGIRGRIVNISSQHGSARRDTVA